MLHAYEADVPDAPFDSWHTQEAINWREDQQARNLGAVVAGLQPSARVLVWCGGGHGYRKPFETEVVDGVPRVWVPMGSIVERYCGVEPFSIDQNLTVAFGGRERPWLRDYEEILQAHGGTAGCLADDLPEDLAERRYGQVADAYVLSLDNAMTEATGP